MSIHRDGDDYGQYILAIKENPIARAVKLADLAHNSDPSRLDGPPDEAMLQRWERYREAQRLLAE